jgi:uracil-DNA glycosylase family 4
MPKNLLLGQCMGCRFEDRQMVPFVGPTSAKLAVVGEYNGREEFKTSIPFTGQAGQVLDGVLEEIGVPRAELRIGNAVICGPLTEEDKEADWFPEVVDRCSMRCAVEKDLGDAKVVVALGGHAALSLLGHKIIMGGRTPVRGSVFHDRDGRIVIPTWNPDAILRAGGSDGKNKLSDADVETIGKDIRKAWDLAHGTISLFKPVVQLESDPAKFVEWVRGCGSRVSIDVETNSADPLTCKLLSVGLARRVRPHHASPPQEASGRSDVPIPAPADEVVEAISFWWPNANEECREALMWLLVDECVTKTYHNLQFDVAVLSRVIDCRVRGPISDTMLLSHARFPDCRVDLGSVAQTWLSLPAWKASYHTWDREREKAIEKAKEKGYTVQAWPEDRVIRLMTYNAWDVAATAAAEPKLVEECEKEGVLIPAAIDVALARVAWKMTYNGVYIDQKIREEVRDDTEQRLKSSYDRMQQIVQQCLANPVNREAAAALSLEIQKDGGEFNPYNQTALPLALDAAGVEVKAGKNSLTATGKRATNKKALAEVSDHPLVAAVFAYKGYSRQKSNFFEKGKLDVGFDHRLHMPWKIHGTPTGRWSSGGDDDDESDTASVNLQNWPGAMRKMVVASSGNVLVGADYKALEYRVVALLAGEQSLLDLFNDPTGPDLHNTNAARLFGSQWDELDPATTDNPFEANRRKTERKILRGLTKNGLYGAMYKGSAGTIQVNLQSRSLKESDPKFAETLRRITKKQCQGFVDAIPRLWPDIEKWRNWAIKDAEDNQCTITPLSGRRRVWPLGMVEPTQAINTRVQSTAGDVMNWRFLELSERLPPEAKIILQVHDSVVVECPETMGADIEKLLVEVLTVDLPLNGNHCIFSVEAKIGHSWADV